MVGPLGMAVWQWKYLNGRLKLVFWLAAVSATSEAIAAVLRQLSINNWPLGNLFLIAQSMFFFLILRTDRPKFLTPFFYIAVLFSVINFAFLQTPFTLNSYSVYASGLLIIMTSLFYLYQLMVEMPVERIQGLPLFWVAFGALIYYGGTLFLFLFNNYLMTHAPDIHGNTWIFHNVLNITKNIFLFLALWVNYKNRASS